jgi:hypothetical protein
MTRGEGGPGGGPGAQAARAAPMRAGRHHQPRTASHRHRSTPSAPASASAPTPRQLTRVQRPARVRPPRAVGRGLGLRIVAAAARAVGRLVVLWVGPLLAGLNAGGRCSGGAARRLASTGARRARAVLRGHVYICIHISAGAQTLPRSARQARSGTRWAGAQLAARSMGAGGRARRRRPPLPSPPLPTALAVPTAVSAPPPPLPPSPCAPPGHAARPPPHRPQCTASWGGTRGRHRATQQQLFNTGQRRSRHQGGETRRCGAGAVAGTVEV